MSKKLKWSINTPQLLEEVLNNEGASVLSNPMRLLMNILGEVANRAIELDDTKLNVLMIRLALYENCTPSDKGYKENMDYVKKYNNL